MSSGCVMSVRLHLSRLNERTGLISHQHVHAVIGNAVFLCHLFDGTAATTLVFASPLSEGFVTQNLLRSQSAAIHFFGLRLALRLRWELLCHAPKHRAKHAARQTFVMHSADAELLTHSGTIPSKQVIRAYAEPVAKNNELIGRWVSPVNFPRGNALLGHADKFANLLLGKPAIFASCGQPRSERECSSFHGR